VSERDLDHLGESVRQAGRIRRGSMKLHCAAENKSLLQKAARSEWLGGMRSNLMPLNYEPADARRFTRIDPANIRVHRRSSAVSKDNAGGQP